MNQLILKPKVSEKAVALADQGTYVFEVPKAAGKLEVAQAVEQAFKVKVARVNMMIIKGKTKRFRRLVGRQSDVKKALVKLEKGQKINLFEGAK